MSATVSQALPFQLLSGVMYHQPLCKVTSLHQKWTQTRAGCENTRRACKSDMLTCFS